MITKSLKIIAPLMLMTVVYTLLSGCAGSTVFLDRAYDFNFIEHVAVIPFDNLSNTQGAGKQATLVFITELLATETFAVVEPGETAKALNEVNAAKSVSLDIEQLKKLGKRLNIQGLFFGTVSESSTLRSGGVTVPVITMDLRLVETETGTTVWSANRTVGRPSLWAVLFGIGGKSSSETMQTCVKSLLKTLIK
jgi:polysaccharide biosynthesis protein PelC